MITRFVPNFFTLGNLFIGILSMLLAIQGFWQAASLMILLSMLLDGIDGKLARFLNAQSDFGKELDSLSDVISFGVAPAIIIYISIFKSLDGVAIGLVTAAFPICGALRLARYNLNPGEPGVFTGLPITAAGAILASVALFKDYVGNPYFFMMLMILLSFLMVSNIKYPAFKKTKLSIISYIIVIMFLSSLVYTFIFDPDSLAKLAVVPIILYPIYGLLKRKDKN